jgi:hypothetical protein
MEFRHPKYYKELRKLRNNLDQAISGKNSTECKTRSPGPGLKVTSYKLPGPKPISNANKGLIHKRQASRSNKRQASSFKAFEPTCSIAKRQASQPE